MKTEIRFFEMEVKHSWEKEQEDLRSKGFIENEFDEMGVKHSWEKEEEVSRCVGIIGKGSISSKGYQPSSQC
jgi:hypothetical protein